MRVTEYCNKLFLFLNLIKDNGVRKCYKLLVNKFIYRHKYAETFNINGRNLLCRANTPDIGIARECFTSEFEILSLLYDSDFDGFIIDAGGYIGAAAIRFAEMFPKSTIVCIEPSKSNYEILKINVSNYNNIHAVNAALVSSNSNKFHLIDRGTGEFGFTIVPNPDDSVGKVIGEVDSVTIEDLLNRFKFKKISLFKIDIEGAEYDLLLRPDWLSITNALFIELYERIVSGTEKLFFETNKNRLVLKSDGEKYLSIGKEYFCKDDMA